MHLWGDEWFERHGEQLDEAIRLVFRFLRKWGKLKYSNKEKYGTMREEFTQFYDGGLHYFVCKSFVRICYPTLYFKIDPIIKIITKYTGIKCLIISYQKFIYNLAHQIACKKYPDIIDEIIQDINFPKLVKPGIFGKTDGKTIHDKYWVTFTGRNKEYVD